MGKLYRACVQVNGQKIWLSAHTKRDLQDKKTKTRQHLRDGISFEKDVNFTEYFNDWMYNVKLPSYTKKHTYDTKETIYRNHVIKYFDKRQMLKAVTRADIQYVLDKSATYSQTVVSTVYGLIRQIFAFAIAEHRIAVDPTYGTIMPKPKEHKTRDSLNDVQLQKVFTAADKLGEDGLIIYILYYLGLRRNEAMCLMWSDFDWEENMVHVQRSAVYWIGENGETMPGTLKTKNADRFIPIPQQLQKVLKKYRSLPNSYLFNINGKLYKLSEYDALWKKIMIQAGTCHTVKRGKYNRYVYDFTPHWFRHTYITMLYDAGIPAQVACRLAGHAKYSTTVNIYTHIKKERMRKQAVKLQGVFKTFAQPLQNAESEERKNG